METRKFVSKTEYGNARLLTIYLDATIGRQKQVSKSKKRFAYELATPHGTIRGSYPNTDLDAFLNEISDKYYVEVEDFEMTTDKCGRKVLVA